MTRRAAPILLALLLAGCTYARKGDFVVIDLLRERQIGPVEVVVSPDGTKTFRMEQYQSANNAAVKELAGLVRDAVRPIDYRPEVERLRRRADERDATLTAIGAGIAGLR